MRELDVDEGNEIPECGCTHHGKKSRSSGKSIRAHKTIPYWILLQTISTESYLVSRKTRI